MIVWNIVRWGREEYLYLVCESDGNCKDWDILLDIARLVSKRPIFVLFLPMEGPAKMAMKSRTQKWGVAKPPENDSSSSGGQTEQEEEDDIKCDGLQ